MEKYEASLSLEVDGGFAHVKFSGGKMYVQWLNDEGYTIDNDDIETSFDAVKRVANFMEELMSLKLDFYSKVVKL